MRKLKALAVLIAVSLFAGSHIYVNYIQTKTDRLYPDKPIHVFFEVMATQPAFMEMIEMVQLPKDEKKVFVWHRFPDRKKLIDLKKFNAVEVDIPKQEGLVYTGRGLLIDRVKKELEKSPKSPLIVYSNLTNYAYLFEAFLPKFPKEQIKHIHLYEDGLGVLYSNLNYFNTIYFTKEDVQDFYDFYYNKSAGKKLPSAAKHMFHTIFPVTYHFFGFEKAKDMFLTKYFFSKMKEASFEDIDFKKLNKTLSEEEKTNLYRFLGFDYEKYRKMFNEKKVFMFFGGFYIGAGNHLYHAEFNYLKDLMKKYPDYQFIFKPHPSYGAFERDRVFDKVFDNVELISAQIPYEIFIIAGLEPDKIAGRSSSLFFTLSNEKIEGYIPHGSYTAGLKLLYNFDEKKWVNLQSYVPEKPLFFDKEIIKDNKMDYLINVDDKSIFLYNERSYYKNKKFGEDEIYCKEELCLQQELVNGKIYLKKVPKYEFQHRLWKDTVVAIKPDKFCRNGTKDCGTVSEQENEFNVCWKRWGCETFVKKENGVYSSIK